MRTGATSRPSSSAWVSNSTTARYQNKFVGTITSWRLCESWVTESWRRHLCICSSDCSMIKDSIISKSTDIRCKIASNMHAIDVVRRLGSTCGKGGRRRIRKGGSRLALRLPWPHPTGHNWQVARQRYRRERNTKETSAEENMIVFNFTPFNMIMET